MAKEGLVLAVRARARLGHVLSSAQHTEGHLQIADSRGRRVAAYLYAPRLKDRAASWQSRRGEKHLAVSYFTLGIPVSRLGKPHLHDQKR
jgi:hypothetical protein